MKKSFITSGPGDFNSPVSVSYLLTGYCTDNLRHDNGAVLGRV